MQAKTPKLVLSISEIALGLILIVFGLYSLSLNLDCPPNAIDCEGWGWLGLAMFTIPGVLIAAAGALSFFRRELSFAMIQMCLVAVIVAYYFWGFD